MKFEHLNIEIGEPVIPKNQVKFEVKKSLESRTEPKEKPRSFLKRVSETSFKKYSQTDPQNFSEERRAIPKSNKP